MLTRRALFYATLTCALALITTAYAAPLNEPTASTTTPEGLAATLEISKLDADLSNSIPNGFASADGATLQPYASTEVDTVAELAPTSLPMTKEEMALAEVAAVVAELATTTAAELKVKEEGKYAEDELEAMQRIWRNAEEAKRQVIAHEIANAVDTLEGGRLSDEKDFVTVETVDTTTTMTPTATTESPQILNELVRAAAAANEILAAALNAANLAATSTNMTNATAVVANENTIATTVQPVRAINTEAGSVDGPAAATARVSDNEGLSEAVDAVTWRPNVSKAKATNVGIEVNGEKTIATATTAATTVERVSTDTTGDLNVSFGAGGAQEKSPEIKASTQLDVQEKPTTTTTATTTTTIASITNSAAEVVNEQPNVEPILWRAGDFLLEHNHSALNKEETPTELMEVTSEVAESTEHTKTKEFESAERAKESLETTPISGDISPQSIELPKDFEASTPHPNNGADGAVVRTQTNIVETANQVAPQATDTDKEFSETQIAEVVEVKQAQIAQDDSEVNETTTSSLSEIPTLIPPTTEPLETLIAVESEAQEPNTIISTAWNELEKTATTTTPEVATVAENVAPLQPTYSELNHQQVITTITPDEKEAATESAYEIHSDISLTTNTTPAAAQHENSFTTGNSADQAESTTTSLASNQHTTTPINAQTELPKISEAAATDALPITTEHSVAAALEISLDTRQLPTTTLSAALQHADTTQFSSGTEETTTPAEATTIPSEVLQATSAASHQITESTAERIQATTYLIESKDSSTDVPLAPFTTTPATIEELPEPEVTTRQHELEAYAVVVGSTEIPQSAAVPSLEITNTADTLTATLSSGSAGVSTTETATTLTAIESAVPDMTTPAAESGELQTETVEQAVEVKTVEALVETVADPVTTNSALVEEQPLHIRTTTEPQQQAYSGSDGESESESIATPTTAGKTEEVESETVTTTNMPNQVDITTATTTSTTTTTSTPEPEIITITTTSPPETTTITTTTTTSAPEPELITTTTTTSQPETTTTTTTTTTTLSPMSLIVAEHEARSLDRTPPRVSRIVSEDGVEVLTGYSIVHHIYAAALAAFEAGGA
ncbi:mucin-22 [Ceratitis capitata]|uniref:mucin-22 n=1 Tax=Ceratitis capitata TaxID=7213 RepID=UPI00061883AC|nr:mucin-22 [Ceratitis capitata]